MIGPDGLLLVVPTYLQPPFQFFGLKKQTWMPEMLLQGHILSTSGDVLRGLKGGRKWPYEKPLCVGKGWVHKGLCCLHA
jgi:hypothetical protein